MKMDIKNIVAVTGKYTNKNGEEKSQYTTIGKLITKDDGKVSVKIDTIPLEWNGWANVYEQRNKEEGIRSTTDGSDLPF